MQYFTTVINTVLTAFSSTHWITHHYHCYSMCVHAIITHRVMISSVWLQDTGDTNSTPVCFCLSCVCVLAHVCVWLHFSSLSSPPSYHHHCHNIHRHPCPLCLFAYTTNSAYNRNTHWHLTVLEPAFRRSCTHLNGSIHTLQTSVISTCCFTLALFLSPCVPVRRVFWIYCSSSSETR